MKYDMNKPCPHCGGNPKIANPTGKCSHIHYPEAVNKELLPLAAEEKAGDEGLRQYLKREIHLLKTQSIEGPFQDGMKYAYENILSRHPAPSRTEELVKRLRDACDHMSVRNEYGVPCMTVGTVTEILSDFEKGAK